MGWAKAVLKVALVAAAIGAAVYWFRLAPIKVVEHRVESGPIVSEVMGTGTLEARLKATISPNISGRIQHVLADQGDCVTAEQPLVQLDDEELTQQVAIAAANVEAARAAIDRLATDRERAAAVLTQAERQHARIKSLSSTRAITAEEVDKSVEALAVAQAGLARAEAAITEGQKTLIAAEKTLEYQRARLADAQVTAPFDGLIIRRDRDPGDVVVPGTSVLALVSTDELWVTAWVDETEMSRLHPSQPAQVIFRSEPDRSYRGEVARLGREVDRETREFVIDVRVLELPQNWAVGQRAEVYVEAARKPDATLLPAAFVSRDKGQPGVFVHSDGRAAWRPLELGLRGRETVEVLDGLEPGDVAVKPVDGGTTLRAGRRVKAS